MIDLCEDCGARLEMDEDGQFFCPMTTKPPSPRVRAPASANPPPIRLRRPET
jgi:hypothetical protein